jgi:hypothetical protein
MTDVRRDDFYEIKDALYMLCDGGCRRCPFKINGDCKADLIVAVLEERMNGEDRDDGFWSD